MKLHCTVEINNRLLPLSNTTARKKPQRSCLAIGRDTVKNNEIHLLLQTQQNKQGTKYKIIDNVGKVFTKFVNDGKATIRLIEPQVDLIIQCDAIQLKNFLHVLKLGIYKKAHPAVLTLSNLNPKPLTSLPKTKVVIKKNSEYPTLEGFSRITEELHIVGLSRKSFDRQILKLQSLRILNLSDNHLTSLPKELGSLPHLQELHLSQNQLGKATLNKWAWLDQPIIKYNLRLLDLSNNSLNSLPEQIGKLNVLVNLKLSQNTLTSLPQNIGSLVNLKYLDLSKNSLHCIPGSLKNLKLILIDVSGNAFTESDVYSVYKKKGDGLASLVEQSAVCFLRTRIPYDASTIPFTLVKFLNEAKYCGCGDACFGNYIRKSMRLDLSLISSSVKSSGSSYVPFDCYFCSKKCFRRYCNTRR